MVLWEGAHGGAAAAATACAVLLACILLAILERRRSRRRPPGPPGLPVIGHLHLWGSLPHRRLRDLARKYGPMMFMRLGRVPVVVASSPEAAKAFLKTHDPHFAGKPTSNATKNMLYDSTDVGFCKYGPYWREVRKACIFHLLSPKRVEEFYHVRAEEIGELMDSIRRSGPVPFNISGAMTALTTGIICRMTFGRKFEEGPVTAAVREYFRLLGGFDISDYLPWLRWLDLQGLTRRQKKLHAELDLLLEQILREHEAAQSSAGRSRDLVDVLLDMSRNEAAEVKITRDNVKAVVMDMLVAGTDTSAGVMEWAMSELIRQPGEMKKVQDELERVVGLERPVQEGDLAHLQYLKLVVRETLRLYSQSPLLVRETLDPCEVFGYEIPAKTRIVVNTWAIGNDPDLWEEAERFKPERFVGSEVDMKGHHFELIPFGSGRRMCAGMHLGVAVAELGLAQLLHCFWWRLPEGMKAEDLDMREEPGFTMPRAVPLLAVPTPRLSL